MKKSNLQNLLCVFIIITPILDILSFIIRNNFNNIISPTPLIRAFIPTIIFIYLFFKNKIKIKTFIVCTLYLIYSIVHLLIFYNNITGISFGNVINEMQYLINYSFNILNLFVFYMIFDENTDKLKKSILFSSLIYISSIYISIFTKTYSPTYIEGMGIKGWFESGNSLSSILVLSLVLVYVVIDKKDILSKIVLSGIFGIYMIFLIGTRMALAGYLIITASYILIKFIYKIRTKINMKFIVGIIIILILPIIFFGSFYTTKNMQRRKYMEKVNVGVIDENTKEEIHVTTGILDIINKIQHNKIGEDFITREAQKAYIKLYDTANELKFNSTNRRAQQLVYNFFLVVEQKSLLKFCFGNGFLLNYAELTLEMEVPALVLNFGIVGASLYIGPFIMILIYSGYWIIKKRKINIEIIMLFIGLCLTMGMATVTGVVFFSQSSCLMIILICVMLLNNIKK